LAYFAYLPEEARFYKVNIIVYYEIVEKDKDIDITKGKWLYYGPESIDDVRKGKGRDR
jgi:hypothetical protein